MSLFATGSGVGDSYATILLTLPNVDWFKQNVIGAVNAMTMDFNWTEDGDVGISFAVEEAEKTLESMIFMNFNPFPVGMVMPYGAAAAPAGYLLCDGASYSTTDYPELFAVVGYTYGGSGTDFNLPDLVNRMVVGGGDVWSIGETGGQQDVFLDVTQIPSHSHTDLGHQHSIPLVTSLPAQAGVGFAGDVTVPLLTNLTGISFANLSSTGGGLSHDNMPPFEALPYIIYAGR